MPEVQLFATCLGDLVFPDAVADAEALLRDAGFEVEFPPGQVCCGQPAFNAGHRRAARRVARTFVRAFSREAPIVVPSGSCATMASRYLPELVGCEPFEVWELSAFLDAHGAQVPRVNQGCRLAYHDSCHMLRELRVSDPPRRLLERSGAQLVPLPRPDLCCGFGGTFSVRQPEVSLAMADDKLGGAQAAEALGGTVHLARTAEEARAAVVEVCRAAGATVAAKAKSMVAEEIGLNEALEAAGVEVFETDLGEYILQLAGEHPVHIVAPAIEKTAEEVARLFSEVEGREIPPDLEALTQAARRQLREPFRRAEVGITGANLG